MGTPIPVSLQWYTGGDIGEHMGTPIQGGTLGNIWEPLYL